MKDSAKIYDEHWQSKQFFWEQESEDSLHFDLFVQKSREKYISTECCADAVIIMAFTWIEWIKRRENAGPFLQFHWIVCVNSTIITIHYDRWLNILRSVANL